jgi:hypothetical protein
MKAEEEEEPRITRMTRMKKEERQAGKDPGALPSSDLLFFLPSSSVSSV